MERSYRSRLFAVIGAGPYGLAVASHLRAAGFEVRIFGKAMDFWDSQMPRGMRLRSPWEGSHIADPQRALTLDKFEADHGCQLSKILPVEDFVRYGLWFQRRSFADLDPRHVVQVERNHHGYCLTLEDSETLSAQDVVIATGIGSFAHYPAPFASLPRELVSHSSERINRDLSRFAGLRVVVIGGGQSAIESAALMSETGAEVEVILRQPKVHWLGYGTPLHNWLHSKSNPFRKMLYPPGNIGPPGVNWVIETPRLFKVLPRTLQERLTARALRPAASGWLRPRIRQVTISPRREVASASVKGDEVRLLVKDGSVRSADHVFLGTGYKISISRMSLLSAELLQAVRTVNGYPILNRGFESSVPGLYFVGATAAHSFGPLCRFVAGTCFCARTLTRYVNKTSARALATVQTQSWRVKGKGTCEMHPPASAASAS